MPVTEVLSRFTVWARFAEADSRVKYDGLTPAYLLGENRAGDLRARGGIHYRIIREGGRRSLPPSLGGLPRSRKYPIRGRSPAMCSCSPVIYQGTLWLPRISTCYLLGFRLLCLKARLSSLRMRGCMQPASASNAPYTMEFAVRWLMPAYFLAAGHRSGSRMA
jgi:hypothetical protein